MKARTKCRNGYIFFVYEDYDGTMYRSWEKAFGDGYGPIELIGYFHSYYYNINEPIDTLPCPGRPTLHTVKQFINHCKKVMED